jgi:long-chain acyl-CoA synthetase
MRHAFRNLANLFHDQAERLAPRTALRHKRWGLYCDVSWDAYRRMVDLATYAWMSLGIQRGDRIAVLAENRYEWLAADLSILASGAANVSLHASLSAAQVAYQLRDSGARWAVVSDAEQLAKIEEVQPESPVLEGIVVLDDRTAPRRGLRYLTWHGLLMRGRGVAAQVAARQRELEDQLGPTDLAALMYTSGTTGEPKGVMLTHGNLLSNAAATCEALPPSEAGLLLSWLPYSHIYARLCDHYLSILAGCTLALAEGLDSIIRNLLEIRPTHMTGVPRLYEKIWEEVSKHPESDQPQRLQDVFGPQVQWLSAGGAPLPEHVADGFQRCGIPLLQGYGLTESSPVIATNRLDRNRVGTVGPPIPGVEVRVADDGEVLTRGPHVMTGYWRKPQATSEVLDADGWLHTGDLGELDADGFLRITGRKKDLIVLASGKKVAPQLIESLLVADALIDQAVVHGDRRKFLSALIVPNFTALAAQAARLGIAGTDAHELVRHPDVVRFFESRVEDRLACVSSPERVKRFVLLDRPFSIAADELTATLKVRRGVILQRYQHELDRLYEIPFEKSALLSVKTDV